ncbi:MAG: hypothetical protein HQL09_02080 [Nitrospirae bacterium]|nr:hypothetical protein [Nitrospirota bacterium]
MKNVSIATAFFLALVMAVFISGNLYAEDQKPATEAPAAAAAPAPAAAPAEDKVTGSVGLGVFNKYIFRGYELSNNSAVIQPTATINYKGFSANVWGNIDTNQHATNNFNPGNFSGSGTNPNIGKTSFNETDLTLSYTYNIDKLALTGGYVYYGTHYADETQELFVSGTYDMIAHPTLAVYRDIDRYPGTYINLSFSQSLPVYKLSNGDVTLDLSAGFGYEAGSSNFWNTYRAGDAARGLGNTGGKYSAFHDGNVKAGFTIPVTKIFSVQPVAQYWFPLSGDASQVITDSTGSHALNPNGQLREIFVYGLNATLNF